ncbi:MAG: oxidoreductase, partial [Rhodoglobus sp.]
MSPRRVNLFAALAGAISSMVTVAVGDLVAQFVAAGSSPLFAVGAFVIDIVPPWVKEAAIALFGTGDKIALLVGLGLLVLVLAVGVGILQYHRAPWGVVGLVLVGVIAGGSAITRAGASFGWIFPTAIGVAAGLIV